MMITKTNSDGLMVLTQKKMKKKGKKPLVLTLRRNQHSISRALGIYQTHRLYGDMVFTDQLFDLNKNRIYTFQLYCQNKTIRQIHIRKNGVLLELEDFDEGHISCIDFIKSRMFSLGNKDAFEFCEILDHYKAFFLNEKEKAPSGFQLQKKFSTLDWIDEIFHNHKEDVLFLRGSKFINSKDFRTHYLGFNFNLLEWITEETNYFSEDFISDCLKIFPMRNHNDFSEVMKIIIGKTKLSERKFINTLLGEIEKKVIIKMSLHPNGEELFHYMVHRKEDFDHSFEENLKKLKNKKAIQDKHLEINRKDTQLYSELMKLYYLK